MSEYAIGVDIGGSGVRVAAFHYDRVQSQCVPVIEKVSSALWSEKDPAKVTSQEILYKTRRHIDIVIANMSGELVAFGIGVPAVIDSKTEKLTAWILKGLEAFPRPLSEFITVIYDRPCIVANDAEAAALAEWKFGAGIKAERMLFFIVSTGVGGAFVEKGVARNGEFGTILVPDGKGGVSWLEPLINTDWFKSQPHYYEEPRLLARRAHCGDALAQKIFLQMGTSLGYAVSTLVNIWQPYVVVFGGGISNALDLFLPAVKRVLSEHRYDERALWTPMVQAVFRQDAGLYGAAALISRLQ